MKKKILIIDDEVDIADVITIALQGDFSVAVRHSIHDPIHVVDEEKPDLIILDLWIPEIGGEKVLNALKNDEHICKIPVVVISADNAAEEIAKKSGADGFLAKPFTVKELRNLIAAKLIRI